MKIAGILHAHSTHSYDGKIPLPELKALLQKEGIAFACMSEHTDELTHESAMAFVEECEQLSDDSFRFIPGFEVPYKPAGSKVAAHILMFGCRSFYGPYAPDAHALRAWASGARFVVLAHPIRNKFIVDSAMYEVLQGVEVWNQQYDGKRVPRPRAYQLFEDMRTRKREVLATGGLDLHRKEHLTYPRVYLDVTTLVEENILEVLISGAFTIESPTCSLPAHNSWLQSKNLIIHMQSVLSISFITLGKKVNKVLAKVGLHLPKPLVRFIRSRV